MRQVTISLQAHGAPPTSCHAPLMVSKFSSDHLSILVEATPMNYFQMLLYFIPR